jgi:hypothetical protein
MAVLAVAWCVQVAHVFDYDSLPITLALRAALRPVLVAFALSYILAYAICVVRRQLLFPISDNYSSLPR